MKKITTITILILLCLVLVLSACSNNSSQSKESNTKDSDNSNTEQGKSNPQEKRIMSLLSEYDDVVFVYKNAMDGANNFTQKVWMGDSIIDIPPMNESAEGFSGTTGIEAYLNLNDHSWGGYMFNIGILESGSDVANPNFGEYDSGLDLTGAEKLTFYARGATGRENVEFFVGGMGYEEGRITAAYPDSSRKISLGFIELTEDWQQYEISLEGADLSKIACGFGWVSNDARNASMEEVRFYIDDIRYSFIDKGKEPIFINSYINLPLADDGFGIYNFAYLYDNALAAMVLSYAGENERAMQIADAMVYALENDRYYEDGRLRNAYANGNPKSPPGWLSAKSKEYARLPGFYIPAEDFWYEDYFAGSTSTGNMAWAMLALCEVYKNNPEKEKYFDAAKTIANFLLNVKDEKGGFTGGYEGWEGESAKVTYKSTEHNIDLIVAYRKLADLVQKNGDENCSSIYYEASKHAENFVLSMYDNDRGCFYTGTTADGITISKDVLPLDSNTWAILALGSEFNDGEKVMDFIEQNMAVDGGYDFNDDLDGVWLEGTAQVALAYKEIGNEEKYEEVLRLLNNYTLPEGGVYAANHDGVSTGLIVSGTDVPWVYNMHEHVGATSWVCFANQGINPFE